MADWMVDSLINSLTIDWKVDSLANLFDVDSMIDRSLHLFAVEIRVNGLNGLEKFFSKIVHVPITSTVLDLFNRAVTNHKGYNFRYIIRRHGKSSLSLLQALNVCNLANELRVKHVRNDRNCLTCLTKYHILLQSKTNSM